MAATLRSKSALIDESTGLYKDNTAGDISASDLRDGVYSAYQPQWACGGRLTTESGVAVSSNDRTAQGTIYYTPYKHDLVGLYDGTSWTLHPFTQRSLALTATSGVNYDVFIYDNSGTLTLELTAWTNDSTRATALTTQDGVLVKTGATTRRYLGTIRASGTNVTADADVSRYVWNFYNRVPRRLSKIEISSHTYNGGYRQWRAQTANKVEFVIGEFSAITSAIYGEGAATTSVYAITGQQIDATNSADTASFVYNTTAGVGGAAISVFQAAAGYHYIAATQSTVSTGTATFGAFNLAVTVLG